MELIEELLTRGVDTIYPSKEELEKVLRSGKTLKLYQGFDPTGTQLHIGHMAGLRKLKQWQALGHEVIFLIGDFTGVVGDPSGKTTARKMLTREEVLKNAAMYKEQAGKILNFQGTNPIQIRYNSEWLDKLSGLEFIKIAGLLSVQQVIERDLFQERKKQGQDVFMNEFLYPVMQAYDSVAMEVDLEIGGTDQMFNMLMGRKLMRHMLKKEKFVMTTPLLTDSQGKKIGKTEGNVIALSDEPSDLFAKIMALGDDVLIKSLEYLTDVPLSKIQIIEQELKDGENPMKYKKLLAYEVVMQLNSADEAQKAQEVFEKTVQKKELPDEIIEIQLSADDEEFISEKLLVDLNLASSKAEAKRLFQQGGVEYNGQRIKIGDDSIKVQDNALLKIGKRKIVKLKIA